MPQWLQQIVAFSRNFGWLIVDTLRNFLSSADTTATVYFNSLQQFCCCNTMPFAAGFWQDSANLFLQFRANQLFMPTRIVLLWKKSSKQGKKENCYLMRKKLQKPFTLFQPTQTFLSKQRPFLSQRNWIELARTHIIHPALQSCDPFKKTLQSHFITTHLLTNPN